ESKDRVTAHHDLLATVHPADRGVLEGGGQMAQPVTVSREPTLNEEDDDIAPALLHRPVPAAGPGRLGNLHESSRRKLADDMPGAVGGPQVGTNDLKRGPALAHDPVKDRPKRPAGIEGWDDNRNREAGVPHHPV